MKKEIRNYEENKISHTAWSDQPDRSNWRSSTFAYLTSTTGTVTNTFTVGNVNFDDDPLTGGLSESKVARDENSNLYVDADGTGEWTVKENKYEDLVAEKWYTKIRPYTWQMIHRTHGYLRKS